MKTQFLLGDFEVAVFAAMKEVEIATRDLSGAPNELVGVKLARRAFNPKGGPLSDSEAEGGERQGMMDSFAGASGVFKNRSSHRRVDYADPVVAAEIVLFADLLLRILRVAKRSDEPKYELRNRRMRRWRQAPPSLMVATALNLPGAEYMDSDPIAPEEVEDDELEELDPVDHLTPKSRKTSLRRHRGRPVSYSGQDFDVEGLVRRLRSGDILVPVFGHHDVRISSAGFQRSFVWNRSQMDRFIESLFLDIQFRKSSSFDKPTIGISSSMVSNGISYARTLHRWASRGSRVRLGQRRH